MADPYGNTLGEPTTITFSVGDFPAYAALSAADLVGVFDTSTPTRMFVTYRNTSSLNFELYALSMDDFARHTGPASFQFRRDYLPNPNNLLRAWTVQPERFPNEYAFAEVYMAEDQVPLPAGVG